MIRHINLFTLLGLVCNFHGPQVAPQNAIDLPALSRSHDNYFDKHRKTKTKNGTECGRPMLLEARLGRNVLKQQIQDPS